MAGRFEGLSDEQWKFFEDLIPGKAHKVGRSLSSSRAVLNTILYVLFTGCRWCDVLKGEAFGKRSTAHERLGKWSKSGVLEQIRRRFIELAHLHGAINWERGSIDGSFSPGQGWWRRRSPRVQRERIDDSSFS
jgi:transposase